MTESEIVLAIPGKWEDRLDLIRAVASKSEGYLMAGNVILNHEKNTAFEVVVYDREEQLRESLAYKSRYSFDEDFLNEIDQHTCIVVVIAKIKELQDVKDLIDVGVSLLKAGGLVVDIETSVLAHRKELWYSLAENKEEFPIYSFFIGLTGNEEMYFSHGMKGFGRRDIIMPTFVTISVDEVADLMNNFNLYYLFSTPNIGNGHTFSVGEDGDIYRLEFIDDFRDENNIFFNPFGLIRLMPV